MMPRLRDELELYLDGWREHLSESWREALDGVEPNLGDIPGDAMLDQSAKIIPDPREQVFHALDDIEPSGVKVVVVGNDPYPDPRRATGRSFEQGDLTDWITDLAESGRVTPSLLSLACAVGALCPNAESLQLGSGRLLDRKGELRRGLQEGLVVLECPRSMFGNLIEQGVLWINRTPTISAYNSGQRRNGTTWRAVEGHPKRHQALWRPVTCAIVSALVEEARERPIVFALFGNKARKLRRQIEAEGRCLGVPRENLCFVESGHPSKPQHFFQDGNPLERINVELTMRRCNRRIDWYGSPAE